MSDPTPTDFRTTQDARLASEQASVADNLQAGLVGVTAILERYADHAERRDEIGAMLSEAAEARRQLESTSNRLDGADASQMTPAEQQQMSNASRLRADMMRTVSELQREWLAAWS